MPHRVFMERAMPIEFASKSLFWGQYPDGTARVSGSERNASSACGYAAGYIRAPRARERAVRLQCQGKRSGIVINRYQELRSSVLDGVRLLDVGFPAIQRDGVAGEAERGAALTDELSGHSQSRRSERHHVTHGGGDFTNCTS